MKYTALSQQGFQLIEVIITLTLIAILSHFLFVNYQSVIATENRHLAESALLQLGAQLEEYAMNNMTYQGATLAKLGITEFVAKKSYVMKIDKLNAHDYQVSAHPLLRQASLDKACGVLSLTSTGSKHISGTGSVITCWQY